MAWGKFVNELQLLIDENTGNLCFENFDLNIKFRVNSQKIVYKHSDESISI